MTSKRVFYGMLALLAVLVAGIIGSAYLGNSKLQSQADKLVALKLKSQVLDTEKTSLTKAKADIAKYQPLATIAKSVVPQDKDQAEAIREIVKIAADSGITPSSITFPASTLGASSVAPLPVAGAAPAPKADTSALSQLTPVKGLAGVFVLPITITQDAAMPVPYSQFIDFLARLEQNRRTAQVSSIVLQPTARDRNLLSFTIIVDEYIKR